MANGFEGISAVVRNNQYLEPQTGFKGITVVLGQGFQESFKGFSGISVKMDVVGYAKKIRKNNY